MNGYLFPSFSYVIDGMTWWMIPSHVQTIIQAFAFMMLISRDSHPFILMVFYINMLSLLFLDVAHM